MIRFLSSWAKNLGLAIVIVSILEMILPNNKTKKYIRMIMGIYILFSIISPLIKNKEIFNLNEIQIEETQSISSQSINQTSMDKRIEELYVQELEKDIQKKVEQKGYEIAKCKVEVTIGNTEEKTKISKIKINIIKNAEEKSKQKEEEDDKSIENIIIEEIQKIRVADASEQEDNNNTKNNISKKDIQNIKKFIMEEYEVSEECLEIN